MTRAQTKKMHAFCRSAIDRVVSAGFDRSEVVASLSRAIGKPVKPSLSNLSTSQVTRVFELCDAVVPRLQR